MMRKKLCVRRTERNGQNVEVIDDNNGCSGVGDTPISENVRVRDGNGEEVRLNEEQEAVSWDDCEVVGDDDTEQIIDDDVDDAMDNGDGFVVEEDNGEDLYEEGDMNDEVETASDSDSGDEDAWNDDFIPDPLSVDNE
ncbi:hypothetical protein AALP_AA1G068000 [Arabis alpina]|uniref:Uncharacterized protein n=1 Tax=Arabis alpina TaxID=50452 RepID=A0A087HLL3_ARAAL|nr:hypothetical protein AALP_AA1G068000 [Arabis alpina]